MIAAREYAIHLEDLAGDYTALIYLYAANRYSLLTQLKHELQFELRTIHTYQWQTDNLLIALIAPLPSQELQHGRTARATHPSSPHS